MPASEALKKPENRVVKSVYPLEEWKIFIKAVVRNRPFAEVLEDLNKLLPLLFPSASGVLYVYAGAQTDLHKVLSFGEHQISDDVIRPGECASFDTGEITITDYAVPSFGTGCTHLHHRPKGLSFCAPIEGFEEHFGIFTVQTDVLPDNESKTDWHFKVSMISSAIGLYIGNQNLNVRYNQHSIRDSLTGLYNRLYVQESLGRAVSSALRNKTPIGMIMLYPDAVD